MRTEATRQFSKNEARGLILDELFDLTLYRSFAYFSTGTLQEMLRELIKVEEGHYLFWQDFFNIRISTLDTRRRIRFFLLSGIARIFGSPAIHVILEAIEINGIRKYLAIWDEHGKSEIGTALERILKDELKHEDAIVARGIEQQVSPERIRNLFLGFNDGLVEMLGAVSGFYAAFNMTSSVLLAGSSVAVAGAISMAAGVYVASGSESEIRATEDRRRKFLDEPMSTVLSERPFVSAFIVGISYFFGALVPLLSVFLSKGITASIIISVLFIIVVSYVVAFLTGMNIRKRILTNVMLVTFAVSVTYLIASAARTVIEIHLP